MRISSNHGHRNAIRVKCVVSGTDGEVQWTSVRAARKRGTPTPRPALATEERFVPLGPRSPTGAIPRKMTIFASPFGNFETERNLNHVIIEATATQNHVGGRQKQFLREIWTAQNQESPRA